MVAKPNIDIYFIFKIVEMETPLPQNCAVDYQLSRSMWMALPSVLQVYLNSLLQNFDVKVQSHNNIIPKRLLSKLKEIDTYLPLLTKWNCQTITHLIRTPEVQIFHLLMSSICTIWLRPIDFSNHVFSPTCFSNHANENGSLRLPCLTL